MADKTTFTADEWKQVLGGVMLAGLAVTAAAPSGLWGTVQEGLASGKALVEAIQDVHGNELVRAAASDFQSADGRTAAREDIKATIEGASQPAEIEARAIEALKRVAALVDAKAPADAPAFKAWLQLLSQRTAEASSEGGFLGFGGITVSDAEKAALAQIAQALGGSTTPAA